MVIQANALSSPPNTHTLTYMYIYKYGDPGERTQNFTLEARIAKDTTVQKAESTLASATLKRLFFLIWWRCDSFFCDSLAGM